MVYGSEDVRWYIKRTSCGVGSSICLTNKIRLCFVRVWLCGGSDLDPRVDGRLAAAHCVDSRVWWLRVARKRSSVHSIVDERASTENEPLTEASWTSAASLPSEMSLLASGPRSFTLAICSRRIAAPVESPNGSDACTCASHQEWSCGACAIWTSSHASRKKARSRAIERARIRRYSSRL